MQPSKRLRSLKYSARIERAGKKMYERDQQQAPKTAISALAAKVPYVPISTFGRNAVKVRLEALLSNAAARSKGGKPFRAAFDPAVNTSTHDDLSDTSPCVSRQTHNAARYCFMPGLAEHVGDAKVIGHNADAASGGEVTLRAEFEDAVLFASAMCCYEVAQPAAALG